MKKISVKRSLLSVMVAVSVVVSGSFTAMAQVPPPVQTAPEAPRGTTDGRTNNEPRREEATNNVEQPREEATDTTDQHRETARTRLQDAKLKACQNREEAINTIMLRMADRGQKHFDLVTSIAERTKEFYVEKGKTLANYDELVANVEAKKAVAESAVANVMARSGGFTCDGDDPRGLVQAFKDVRQIRIDAMGEYRTAVKDLIVGVKSVQSVSSEGGR